MLTALLLLVQAPAACPATPAAPPAGWAAHRAVAATATGTAPLTPGQGTRATLLPAASVRLPAPPHRPAAAGTHSGVFAFDVARPGRYRVSLGAGAWVDVVANGRALASVAHGHGPACSPVKKMVDFDLKPGRYLLQVAGNATATLDLLVAPAG